MPLTSFNVSSRERSGQIRPSKPSGIPITFHLYFSTADFTAARMTALSPGASPPPVPIPMHRISHMMISAPVLALFRSYRWKNRRKPLRKAQVVSKGVKVELAGEQRRRPRILLNRQSSSIGEGLAVSDVRRG